MAFAYIVCTCATPLITVVEQITAHIYRLHLMLTSEHEGVDENQIRTLGSEMGCALSHVQGMCLTNYPSKQLCSTRSILELLLTLVSANYSQTNKPDTPLRLLASHALDTLMCILVDASPQTRSVFEQAHGPSIVRRVMNLHPTAQNAGRSDQTDLDVTGSKCFEFLLFYLQAKSFEMQAAQQHSGDVARRAFQAPETPLSAHRGHARSRSEITASPFYTPLASPRVTKRVVSHGSPTKHVAQVRQQSSQLTDLNPFARAQERHRAAREKKAEEALVTSRATRRHVRDTSPKRPGISFEFPKRIPATAKPTPTDPDTNWDRSVYERSSERAFDRW